MPKYWHTITFKKIIDLPKSESAPLEHTYKPSTCEIMTSNEKKWEIERGKILFLNGIAQKENLKQVIKTVKE